MSEEIRKREQHVTQQWVDKGVFEALRKCADRRPDLMINVRSLKTGRRPYPLQNLRKQCRPGNVYSKTCLLYMHSTNRIQYK